MAVEIPVVVDIDGAFRVAAQRAKSAMKPLQEAIEQNPIETKITIGNIETTNDELKKLNDWYKKLEEADWSRVGKKLDLTPQINSAIMELQKLERELNEIRELRAMEGGQGDFSFAEEERRITEQARAAAASIAALEKAQASLNASMGKGSFQEYIKSLTTTNEELVRLREDHLLWEEETRRAGGSINALRNTLSGLVAEYNELSAAERKAEGGRGSAIYAEYRKVSEELRVQARDLSNRLELERRHAERIKETVRQRRYETAILNSNANSLHILSEKQRILNERLQRAKIGSKAYQELQAQLRKVSEELQKATGNVGAMTNAMGRQSVVMRNLASISSMYFSVFGLLRFARQLRDVTGELEYQQVALSHLIQDEKYGAALFEKIKEKAIESPFRIKDLVTYTKQLAAYRVEQEKLFDTTSRLADISAGLGVDMNRLILAYGQVRAASVLRGQELRQFTEAGIPLVELLAEKMGELNEKTYTTADVFRLISERAVPFSAIAEIFEDLTEKGGMFYEMQERQAETLKGRWEKLKDAFDIGLQAAGETKTFEVQNRLLLNTLTLLAKNVRIVPKLIEAMGAAWVTYSAAAAIAKMRNKEVAKSSIEVMTTEQLKAKGVKGTAISMLGARQATKMLTRANTALAVSNGFLARSFAKLQLFLLTNPIGALATAVAGIVTFFAMWKNSSDKTTDSLGELDKAIEQISKDTSAYKRADKLISRYEKLASNTKRTTSENNKLYNTMSALSEMFPELTEKIYDENASLEKNVELLRGRNEALMAESKKDAVEKLVVARGELSRIDKDIREAEKKARAAQKEAREFLGENKYEDLLKSQQRRFDRLNEKAKEAERDLLKLQEDRTNEAKKIETLENYIDPAHAKAFETAWQNTIARMKDVKVDGETISLIGDEDIRKYESLYDALKKIDKAYKDSTNSLKEMKAGLSSVSEEYKEQARQEIAAEQARVSGYKAILDTFGYTSSIDKKSNASDLAILKEELKTVQDIYKKYQEFEKYLGKEGAKRQIEKIYGNVTAIDFLDPASYKNRLEKILKELRKIQNRYTSSAVSLSKEAFNDIKETIKKNEGFLSKAYKVPGEPNYSIGYGFYDTLPDGRKVAEGMTMTREEADKLLDLAIDKRLDYVNRQIEKYGNGLVFNEKQMNVLLDLAYQSGSGVARVLKAANGDANKLVEELKSAASSALISEDPDVVAGVKKRDMRRAEAFRLAMAEQTEDMDAVSEAISSTEKLVQDVDWEELKRKMEAELKKLSDEIKRSETARNFYKNILDLTGDEDLATNLTLSVYGGVGEDFKDRLQRELYTALKSVPTELLSKELSDEFSGAITTMDTEYMWKNLDVLPDKVREVFRKALESNDKYNADIANGYAKLLLKYSEIEQQKVDISAKAANDIVTINEGLALELDAINKSSLSKEEKAIAKQNAEDRAEEARDARTRDKDIQLSRLEDDYRLFFNSVRVISVKSAKDVAQKQKQMLTDQFVRGQISLSKYKRELKEVDEQLKKYTSTDRIEDILSGEWSKAISDYLSEMSDGLLSLSSVIKTSEGIWSPTEDAQNFVDKVNRVLNFGNFAAIFNGEKKIDILKEVNTAAKKAYKSAIDSGKSQRIANNEANNAAREALAKYSKELVAALDSLAGVYNVLVALLSALEKIGNSGSALFDSLEKHNLSVGDGYLGEFFDSMGDFFGGILSLMKLDFAGAWEKYTNLFADARYYNGIISEQSKIVEDLDYQYSRLENSIQKAFGSDYITNYNKQLEALYAKQAAYEKQAEAERAKDKAADQDKIKEYENNARAVGDQIMDMKSQLSEFFAGTDITSAAKDFASSWIEAYKEFGSTTDAMKEKFQDMIQEMIVNSLAAEVMQAQLKPIFDLIDTLSQDDNQLSASDIAKIAALANDVIPQANDALMNTMAMLNTAGYNIRQQPGQFTGIKRNIANATEESINGLTQAMNVNNFYMSHIPTLSANVAQILAIMSGGTAENPVTGSTFQFNNEIALQYMSALPSIDEKMADLLRTVKSVVSDKNSATNINVVAVRA